MDNNILFFITNISWSIPILYSQLRVHSSNPQNQHPLTTSNFLYSTENTLKINPFCFTLRRTLWLLSVHVSFFALRLLSAHNCFVNASNQSFWFCWLAPDTTGIAPPSHSPPSNAPRVACNAIDPTILADWTTFALSGASSAILSRSILSHTC